MSNNVFWSALDSNLDQLMGEGYCQLSPLDDFDLEFWSEEIIKEMGDCSFKARGSMHLSFLEELEIDRFLTPKLHEIAVSCLGYKDP